MNVGFNDEKEEKKKNKFYFHRIRNNINIS